MTKPPASKMPLSSIIYWSSQIFYYASRGVWRVMITGFQWARFIQLHLSEMEQTLIMEVFFTLLFRWVSHIGWKRHCASFSCPTFTFTFTGDWIGITTHSIRLLRFFFCCIVGLFFILRTGVASYYNPWLHYGFAFIKLHFALRNEMKQICHNLFVETKFEINNSFQLQQIAWL